MTRFANLELQLERIAGRLETLTSEVRNCATKAELAQAESHIIRWHIGTMIALIPIVAALVHFVK